MGEKGIKNRRKDRARGKRGAGLHCGLCPEEKSLSKRGNKFPLSHANISRKWWNERSIKVLHDYFSRYCATIHFSFQWLNIWFLPFQSVIPVRHLQGVQIINPTTSLFFFCLPQTVFWIFNHLLFSPQFLFFPYFSFSCILILFLSHTSFFFFF